MRPYPLLAVLMAGVSLSACTLAPHYERPPLPVSPAWPATTGTSGPAAVTTPGAPSAGALAWRDVFQDARLQRLIDLALVQNRDLRVAVGNIERARATYRIQRAALLPTVVAGVAETRAQQSLAAAQPGVSAPAGATYNVDQYTASVGVSAYELDLFGRVRSLSQAALQSYFAVEENRRAVQISLIAEVATDYLTLAADEDALALARNTVKSRDQALDLAQKRFQGGATSQLDLSQVQTLAEQARSDAAAAAARVDQDRNALRLVVGTELPADLLTTGDMPAIAVRADLPAGLPAEILVRRPDVLSAEHTLQGQNANIGAARAAFFPRISLTGSTGLASDSLNNLFSNGTGVWSFTPQITLPIFAGGANLAGLRGARAGRDIAVAQYEHAIQTGFREVADALAIQASIRDQIAAQERLVAAAESTRRLSQARYDSGIDSFLTVLDAQRTLYGAQQTLLNTRLAEVLNRVRLYRALGGGA
jgi:multidrug efflux system outer membrane protein